MVAILYSAILNSAILNSTILESAILVFCLKLTHTCQEWFPPFTQKKTSLTLPSPPFAQKKLHSCILSELDNGNHLEFCHVGFRHWHHGIQIHCYLLSDSLNIFSLQSDSDSNYFNLTQTDSFSLNWWWIQPSWILTSWIQLLHCGIQTPCFPLPGSLKNTLTPIWLCLKLIESHSN